jgi:hypothetical protein
MANIVALRRHGWWMFPCIFACASLIAWFTISDMQKIVKSITTDSPVLYIQSISLISPFVSATLFLLLAVGVARYYDLEKFIIRLEKWLLLSGLTTVFLIPMTMIVGSLIQHHYLPKLGYSKCNILFNGRSMLANTWIKPADLCVYNKTTSWVREEAAKRASQAKPNQ